MRRPGGQPPDNPKVNYCEIVVVDRIDDARSQDFCQRGYRRPQDPHEANVLFGVWLISRAVSDLLDTVLEPSGLDSGEFAVYTVLAIEGAMTPTELARWMAAPPTTVSSYIKRFEGRGHLRRAPNPDDRRSYRIELTDAGLDAHRQAAAAFRPVLGQVVAELGEREPAVRAALLDLRAAVTSARGRPVVGAAGSDAP